MLSKEKLDQSRARFAPLRNCRAQRPRTTIGLSHTIGSVATGNQWSGPMKSRIEYETLRSRTKLSLTSVNFLSSLYCPSRISPIENSGCFPRGKPAATEWRYPTHGACRCFSVSLIHRALTWTTGSLTCAQVLMHAIAHGCVRTP